MSEKIKTVLIVLSASVMYGLYPAATRGAYADGANAVFLIIITTLMRAGSLAAFCVVRKYSLFLNFEETKTALKSGLIQACSIICLLGALVYLPGPIVTVLLFTNTLMLLLFLLFKKEIDVNKWLLAATFLCFIGIMLVVDVWDVKSSGEIIGYILAFIGAVATASRLYIFGKLTKLKHPIVVGAETFLAACFFLFLLMFYQMPVLPHSLSGFVWTFLSALSLTLGSFAMFYGISKIGSFHFSLYNKLEPVFTVIFSALLMNEILNFNQYLGMAIVISSLVGYQLWDHRQKSKLPPVVEEI